MSTIVLHLLAKYNFPSTTFRLSKLNNLQRCCIIFEENWFMHSMRTLYCFRKFAYGERLEGLVQNSVSKVIAEIGKKGDTPVDIRPVIMLLVFNISCGMAYGKE